MNTAIVQAPFSRMFFSLSLYQQFNRRGRETGFASDEDEAGVRKYARIVLPLRREE